MTWRLAATIWLLAGVFPAHAQNNLDQGKAPAQIFADDCASCHRTVRGLAKGKNGFTLADFLREHYTTSREQAAALAAYVLKGGGGESNPAGAQGRSRGAAPSRSVETTPANAKLQRPADEEAKPVNEIAPGDERRPTAGRHERRPIATRLPNRRKQPETGPVAQPVTQSPAQSATHEPAPVIAEPVTSGSVSRALPDAEASPAQTDTVPLTAEPGEGAPVPRDDIPD